ncbi:hypothetical protein Mapa_009203 [Marchantia paleacea]|nr:hypothetical protein Mapa_009203 [Marchantia paleacea]
MSEVSDVISSENMRCCALCGKEGVKNRCSVCVQVYYCDRECQVSDWKTHRPICKVLSATNGDAPPAKTDAGRQGKKHDFSAGFLVSLLAGPGLSVDGDGATTVRKADANLFSKNYKWDEGLTHEEVYVKLIDSFRLRRDDEYTFSAEICEFYGGGNPLPGFKHYMKQAKKKKILPSWWTSEDDRKINVTSMSHEWANLNYAVEKSDIEDHYFPLNKPFEHVTLRLLAEQITGQSPCTF